MIYSLTLAGRGVVRRALYDPMVSSLTWEDGTPLAPPQGGPQAPAGGWRPFWHVNSPSNPGGKSRDARHLKIQLGLKCNYACTYCSQAHQPHDSDGHPGDLEPFMAQLARWFAGGADGRGKGVTIEFWGGEPFAYWKLLRPLGERVRARYPNAALTIVTNGSLLDDEKLAWVEALGIGIGLSHDGPGQSFRGPDPLDDPRQLANIKRFYARRGSIGMMSFNCVLHAANQSLDAVRRHIAARLDLPQAAIRLSTEEIMLPYDAGGMMLSLKGRDHADYLHTMFNEIADGSALSVQTIKKKLDDFFSSLAGARPLSALGQKCGMDRAGSLAIDLKGNALTCQNMSADTRHGIGHVDAFDDIRLTTAHHFSTRPECPKCPVVQLCQGACMFLEDRLWGQACDNSFTHNLAVLAGALYHMTGLRLTAIEGEDIRGRGERRVAVVDPARHDVRAA